MTSSTELLPPPHPTPPRPRGTGMSTCYIEQVRETSVEELRLSSIKVLAAAETPSVTHYTVLEVPTDTLDCWNVQKLL